MHSAAAVNIRPFLNFSVGAVIELAGLTEVPVTATRNLHALVRAKAAALGLPV